MIIITELLVENKIRRAQIVLLVLSEPQLCYVTN